MSLDSAILREYEEKKLIRRKNHSTLPLVIQNYTEKCQIEKAWDEITNICRGLITDIDGNIIARSFDKFHNIEDNRHQVSTDFIVQEKVDGSLGILFYYDKKWHFASRGSFDSEQALKAKEILKDQYSVDGLDESHSYIFEIIYPSNRVVVDYAGKTELVYLASFLPDGQEFFEKDLMLANGFPVVKEYDGISDFTKIQELDWKNAEGFVVIFKHKNGISRCKIKFENYKALHRIVTNLSPLSVWNWFSSGREMTDFDAPDEWHAWYTRVWRSFQQKKDDAMRSIEKTFESIKDIENRGDFARKVKELDAGNSSIYFALRDNRVSKVHEMICTRFKPTDKCDTEYYRPFEKESKIPSHIDERVAPIIMILIGISASGKSSWATSYVHSHNDTVIISRDSIRTMLWGKYNSSYYDHPRLNEREQSVTTFELNLIQFSLDQCKSVIIDDTNLLLSTINTFVKTFSNYDISFKLFEIDLSTAVDRDNSRDRIVGSNVIKNQFQNLTHLKKVFDFEERSALERHFIPKNLDAPKKAYIFDMDGTLCDNVTRRSYYDWSRVKEDAVRTCVKECAVALHKQGFVIIICTGRDACCRDACSSWLESYEIPFHEIHMRPMNDIRSDRIIKEELWRDICSRYDVQALFDDRQQVVDHARRLGLEVFQVAPNKA